MMRGEAGLLADLGILGVPFAAFEHDAVFTVAESDAVNAAVPLPVCPSLKAASAP